MRTRNRLFVALLLAAASACATLALAQPRGRGRSKHADKRDAQAADAQALSGDAASAVGPTPPPADIGDGGVRPSPLNPEPGELPSGSTVEAGAPSDYDRLLADIAALRARVAAVSDTLYRSRIQVALETEGDHAKIGRLTVSLDDGVVFTAPKTFSASDMTTVYDHAVAPGRHAVTVEVDRRDDRREAFRTSQRSRFTVEVPRDQRLRVQVRILDDSDMGEDFPEDRNGRYDLRFRVRAVAEPAGE